MYAVLSDMLFFGFLFSVTRLCAGLGRNVNHRRIFLRTTGKRIASTKLGPPDQAETDEQRSHSALVEDKTF